MHIYATEEIECSLTNTNGDLLALQHYNLPGGGECLYPASMYLNIGMYNKMIESYPNGRGGGATYVFGYNYLVSETLTGAIQLRFRGMSVGYSSTQDLFPACV